MYRRLVTLKLSDVSEAHTASKIRAMMMEAVRTSFHSMFYLQMVKNTANPHSLL